MQPRDPVTNILTNSFLVQILFNSISMKLFFVLGKTLNTPHHELGVTLKRPALKNDIILTKVMLLQSCFIIFKSFTHGTRSFVLGRKKFRYLKVGLRYFAKRSK